MVAKRNICFMREVSFVTAWSDPLLLVDLAFGLPALGWAKHAPTMALRYAPPKVSIESLLDDAVDHNARIWKSTRSSTDRSLDELAWEKT